MVLKIRGVNITRGWKLSEYPPHAGDTVQFKVGLASGKIDTIHWDFGDGHTADVLFPMHIFTAPGTAVVGTGKAKVKAKVVLKNGRKIKAKSLIFYVIPRVHCEIQCEQLPAIDENTTSINLECQPLCAFPQVGLRLDGGGEFTEPFETVCEGIPWIAKLDPHNYPHIVFPNDILHGNTSIVNNVSIVSQGNKKQTKPCNCSGKLKTMPNSYKTSLNTVIYKYGIYRLRTNCFIRSLDPAFLKFKDECIYPPTDAVVGIVPTVDDLELTPVTTVVNVPTEFKIIGLSPHLLPDGSLIQWFIDNVSVAMITDKSITLTHTFTSGGTKEFKILLSIPCCQPIALNVSVEVEVEVP